MTYPIVQFVSAPDPDATVRLDLNSDFGAAKISVNADDFSLGAPSYSGEPGGVGGVYGYRALNITPRITGPKAAALTLLTLLAREQGRASNWVHFKLDEMTASVWHYVYKSAPQPLSLDEVDVSGRNPDVWTSSLSLSADPLAFGERITLGPYTVTQDPDVATPMRVVLPAIEGDAPAPLRVTLAPPTADDAANENSSWLLGSVSGSTSAEYPLVGIGTGDGFTAGAGTAADATDAAYFGGSYREVTVGAAAVPPNFLERLSGTFVLISPARYKVLLRCTATGVASATNSYIFALSVHRAGTAARYATSVTQTINPGADPTTYNFRGWVDLGDFYLPAGGALPAYIIAPDLGTTMPSTFSLKVGTPDGAAGTVRLDSFLFIPLDGPDVVQASALLARFDGSAITDNVDATFDGDSESFYAVNTNTGVRRDSLPVLQGGFPIADPAADQNVVVVVATDHGDASGATAKSTSKGAEVAATVSYLPRKLRL